jgi:hypothetical protein
MALRIQIVMQGRSNVAEDQFVNTIHVDKASYTAGDEDTISQAIFTAQSSAPPGGGHPISWYWSRFLDPGLAQVRVYDLSQPEPRPPHIASLGMLAPPTGSNDLPEEVSLCMSFHGLPPYTARRRGRIYLGPLSTIALGDDSGTAGINPSRPDPEFQLAATHYGHALAQELQTAGYVWCIRSTRPSENFVRVVGGHVDNAWDTQRRRGVKPTARYIWPDIGS